MQPPSAPLVLALDADALRNNWRWLATQSGKASCGAAVKADGYGLGATEVVQHLKSAGCRNFFVATWAEALSLKPHIGEAGLSVLHGVREEDMAIAKTLGARPVLSTPAQIQRWRDAGGGPCDVMIDTGMNRLGLDANDVSASLFQGLEVDTVMSHLACADEMHPLNAVQQMIFASLAKKAGAKRLSLANSAGIFLGEKYHFDLTRPGLSISGGATCLDAELSVRQVVRPRAQILQRRTIRGGESVGYGASYSADRTREAAVINLGYADGYLRGFSNSGYATADDGTVLPVMGRVSMDLVVIDVTDRQSLGEGDWVEIAYDLSQASIASGLSQYELLTGLGSRFDRKWI
ncbi:MAG TPA: alanine racemase [Sphingobium sp.]